jgi:hypothetical protein
MELNRDLIIYQGDDIIHKVVLTHPDGSVFDIIEEGGGDYSYTSRIRLQGETSLSPPGMTLATFDWDEADTGNLEQGIVIFTLAKEDSKLIPPGRHVYDVKQIEAVEGSSPDVVLTLFSGLAIVLPEVTKSFTAPEES